MIYKIQINEKNELIILPHYRISNPGEIQSFYCDDDQNSIILGGYNTGVTLLKEKKLKN